MRGNIVAKVLGITIVICGVVFGIGVLARHFIGEEALQQAEEKNKVPTYMKSQQYELEKTSLEAFENININASYTNVEIVPSDGYYLEYNIDCTNAEIQYATENGTFTFQEISKGGFSFDLSFGDDAADDFIKLYVPQDVYFQSFVLHSEGGNIDIKTLEAKDIDIQAEYGNVNAEQITGSRVAIEMESGNVSIDTLEADQIELSNEYGNISFAVTDSLGNYSCDLHSEYGRLDIPNEFAIQKEDDECSFVSQADTGKLMQVVTESGNISITEK